MKNKVTKISTTFVAALLLTSMLGTNAIAAQCNTVKYNKIRKANKYFTATTTQAVYNQPITLETTPVATSEPAAKTQQVQEQAPAVENAAPVVTNQQPVSETVKGLTAEEQQMVDLVNAERVKNGLKPLEVDMRLVEMARLKSQDMIDKNYFDHNSPTYGSPFDMMKTFNIAHSFAGENIAGNSSVDAAHTSLMNSPGHRANILNANFTKIGIGIKDGGPYGKMFSQEFIG